MKVVIIGSGNVATVFGKKILLAGHQIIQIAGRNAEKVRDLASELKCTYTSNTHDINTLADIYIIAVSDRSISAVARQLKLNKKIVVHTAAAVSKEVLAGSSDNYGVLYPLQTFRREVTSIPVIPILVDGNTDDTRNKLIQFASPWADNVLVANDEERLKLHVAAVFVNNFTNHLFAIAQDICSTNHLDFNILKPLIEETISRVQAHAAADVQTGAAIRKDVDTMEKHRKILESYPGALQLYNVLSNSIIKFDERK